jgi:hypothetical protein
MSGLNKPLRIFMAIFPTIQIPINAASETRIPVKKRTILLPKIIRLMRYKSGREIESITIQKGEYILLLLMYAIKRRTRTKKKKPIIKEITDHNTERQMTRIIPRLILP